MNGTIVVRIPWQISYLVAALLIAHTVIDAVHLWSILHYGKVELAEPRRKFLIGEIFLELGIAWLALGLLVAPLTLS